MKKTTKKTKKKNKTQQQKTATFFHLIKVQEQEHETI